MGTSQPSTEWSNGSSLLPLSDSSQMGIFAHLASGCCSVIYYFLAKCLRRSRYYAFFVLSWVPGWGVV